MSYNLQCDIKHRFITDDQAEKLPANNLKAQFKDEHINIDAETPDELFGKFTESIKPYRNDSSLFFIEPKVTTPGGDVISLYTTETGALCIYGSNYNIAINETLRQDFDVKDTLGLYKESQVRASDIIEDRNEAKFVAISELSVSFQREPYDARYVYTGEGSYADPNNSTHYEAFKIINKITADTPKEFEQKIKDSMDDIQEKLDVISQTMPAAGLVAVRQNITTSINGALHTSEIFCDGLDMLKDSIENQKQNFEIGKNLTFDIKAIPTKTGAPVYSVNIGTEDAPNVRMLPMAQLTHDTRYITTIPDTPENREKIEIFNKNNGINNLFASPSEAWTYHAAVEKLCSHSLEEVKENPALVPLKINTNDERQQQLAAEKDRTEKPLKAFVSSLLPQKKEPYSAEVEFSYINRNVNTQTDILRVSAASEKELLSKLEDRMTAHAASIGALTYKENELEIARAKAQITIDTPNKKHMVINTEINFSDNKIDGDSLEKQYSDAKGRSSSAVKEQNTQLSPEDKGSSDHKQTPAL